ncbi:MAG: phosphoglucosamine mutase [Bacteroidetes bacterium]|nr:phosphoglucosamine mutase [Bacteroidota bacterium]
MSLIASISGIRGTIGGEVNGNLTPIDIVKFSSAYATWLTTSAEVKPKVVVGRDARISGLMVNQLVIATLMAMGVDVVDIGLTTTPTLELAVVDEKASGGIVITASHNPKEWNALKLLNADGEFVSEKDGEAIKLIAEKSEFLYASVDKLGILSTQEGYIQKHIEKILALGLVDVETIKSKNYKVVIDCVNSTGGIALPELLYALGVKEVIELYCTPSGLFPHNPEPLPQNLSQLASDVKFHKAHLGIAVDPDVDRLCFVNDDGDFFGEEYTLVAIADYILKNKKGATVSNLSSTRALRDITLKNGCKYFASAVGEVNVVKEMKKQKAVIGGEGNGGIIYPELHYGRDAMVGIALFLSHLAKSGKNSSILRSSYPNYYMSKSKIELNDNVDLDSIIEGIKAKYIKQNLITIDGLKIEFEDEWVHLRRSNTESIIRIYTESQSQSTSDFLAKKIIEDIKALM